MRNPAERSSPRRGSKAAATQPVARDQNVEHSEGGSKPENDRQDNPAPNPAVDELMIRRIMAALMAEE
jgi:hypothetical protein